MPLLDRANLELLCQPLSNGDSCGVDMRYEPVFDRIVELARSDDDGMSLGVWERDVKRSDWEGVAELCFDVLQKQTKDLQVAAWFSEALFYLDGARGAVLGWNLLIELAVKFWPDVHPRFHDVEDLELRLRPIYWLAQRSKTWLLNEPSKSASTDVSSIFTNDTASGISLFEEWLQKLIQFEGFLKNELNQNAPMFYELNELLNKRLTLLNASKGNSGTIATSLSSEQSFDASPSSSPQFIFASRDTAYERLKEVAIYLAETEPHSPVPMILEALIEWRGIPFWELLERLPQDRANVYELLKFFRNS